LSQTGVLATTSANLSGQPALATMAEIDAQFPEVMTLESTAPDFFSENTVLSQPSTVAKWTGSNWQILRQGAVNLDV
jgi:L-threonylcarbamoyladenylate synthase